MSEQVLTGPLLDFGTSFWRSSLATEEFPGLMASGMHAIGRFGIGFFSVFMLGSVVRVFSRRCDKGQEAGRLLEFRGGTSARPILSAVGSGEAPIDGGTRVEVLLKGDPYRQGGLLSAGTYRNDAIRLSRLVAAIAPNLDVALIASDADALQPIARPGDWLKMKDVELITRLNPLLDGKTESSKADRALMKPLVDENGAIYGRAFINPSQYSYSPDGGWVTISGLRASRLHNVQGVLLGEAVTAARDSAQPLATKEALAAWASQQAQLIAKHVADEERQAMSAEVVLECGGDVGTLKIVKWGADWLDVHEFSDRLYAYTELVISFRGEVDYDEDRDDVHPKEFRQEFKQSDDVALVLKHDGGILRLTGYSWPRVLMGLPDAAESRTAAFVRDAIAEVWSHEVSEDEDEREVGKVGSTEIIRNATVFTRLG
jgi:hypothetical protein